MVFSNKTDNQFKTTGYRMLDRTQTNYFLRMVAESTLRLLIVEDMAEDMELIVLALEAGGVNFNSDTAQTATECKELLQNCKYDAVLSDYRLPGFNGLEVLKLMQELGQDIPFILVTGSLGEEAAVECIKAGMTDYVLKGRLFRLPTVLERSLQEYKMRHQQTEAIAQIQRQATREAIVNRIVQAMRFTLVLDEVLQTTADQLHEALEISGCAILQPDAEGGIIVRYMSSNAADREQFMGLPCKFAQHYRSSLARGETVAISDLSTLCPSLQALAEVSGFRALAIAPLIYQQSFLGGIGLYQCDRDRTWTAEELSLVKAIADQCAIAIHQAELYQRAQTELAERKRAEAAVRGIQQQLATMAANIPGSVYRALLHPDGTTSMPYISPGVREVTGIGSEEVMARPELLTEIIHPDDKSSCDSSVAASRASLLPCDRQYRIVLNSGEVKWVQDSARFSQNENGDIIIDGVALDISDRKEAEAQRNLALAREQAARLQAEASEQLYRVLAEAIPQIVWTALPDGWVDYYNQRWFEYTGMTLAETQGWGWSPVLHPDDVENCLERWNTSVQTGETYEVEYRFKRASDGAYRWHLGRALPVRDAEGKIIKWFGTCTDIDDRQRETQTADFRARALALLSSASLDYQEALQGLADLAVPGLGDWCCVHLMEPDGSIRLQAVANSDPSQVALLWQIDLRLPVDPQGRHGVAKVLRTGESKLYPEIPGWAVEAVVSDSELLKVLRSHTPLSAICVPLIARGRTLGAISLLCGESGRRCSEGDLVLLEDLARDAAVAIDNARLYREAAEANRIKDEFLATLSHELRTPLNAILGWAQILRQRKLSDEKTAVALETIERNARLQTQMIEDLLDVSRIVSGKVCLKLSPVNLVRTVETAVKALGPDAEVREVELATFYGEGVSAVRGDATRLQQVVWNLLSNAIKFTPPGGRVEIRLSEEGEPGGAGSALLSPVHSVAIAVSDTGIGISKEFLPFVFDRFRQADSTSTRNYGGLGLGLAIVRHLVELHGGTVWAESPGEGLGSTFGVRLPI